ncbi:MAG: hypothetical protein ABIJ00_00980 [Candidatus Eisenbacteria bacterium]
MKVSVLTIFGILFTVGIGLMLRRVLPFGSRVIASEGAFVFFIIYGLAFSLLSSATTVIRTRDAVILIFAATIIWGVFLEGDLAVGMIRCLALATCIVFAIRWLPVRRVSSGFRTIAWRDVIAAVLAVSIVWGVVTARIGALGMVRFITFATLVTLGLLIGRGLSSGSAAGWRVCLGTVFPAVLCGIGGLIYRGVVTRLVPVGAVIARPVVGSFWGLSLGLAVGLGISIGSEVVEWMVGRVR